MTIFFPDTCMMYSSITLDAQLINATCEWGYKRKCKHTREFNPKTLSRTDWL